VRLHYDFSESQEVGIGLLWHAGLASDKIMDVSLFWKYANLTEESENDGDYVVVKWMIDFCSAEWELSARLLNFHVK
jgi:hypothetical protein